MIDIDEPLTKLAELQKCVKMNFQHQYQGFTPEHGHMALYGVTSVIGQLAKPALDVWKLRTEREHVAKLSYALRPEDGESRELYTTRLQQAAGEFGYKRISSGAADRGHNVHSAVEHFLTDRPIPTLVGNEKPMFDNFVEWWAGTSFKPIMAEFKIANFDIGYAGTADMLIEDENGLILADLKTSKASSSTYPEHSLQSAAYRGALYNLGFPPMRGLIIQTDRNGGGVIHHWLEEDISKPYAAFCGLVNVVKYLDAREELLSS